MNAKKLPYLLALAAIEDEKRDNTMTIVKGVLDLDNGKIADNILSLSLAELIKTKATEKETPEKAGTATEAEKPTEAPKKPTKRTKSAEKDNTPTEPEKAVKTEIDEKLPWEKESAPVVPVAPAPDPEPEKQNLLFDEIEI